MELKHQMILDRIKNQETESNRVPQDILSVHLQLASKIEESNEYVEDPGKLLARNMMGQLYRMKLKVTLSY